MLLTRRHATTAAAAVAACAAPATWAQAPGWTPQEGRHFRRLAKPLPNPPGKVEVLEFFLYTCPHCDQFENQIGPWKKTLPPQVAFRPVHVGANALTKHFQRVYFTLEAMGVEAQFRSVLFNAIHRQRQLLDTSEAVAKLLGPAGLDTAKFTSTFNAFGVSARINAANQLSAAYALDGVPCLGIGGQFLTSPEMARNGEPLPEAQSGQRALAVANLLIARLGKA